MTIQFLIDHAVSFLIAFARDVAEVYGLLLFAELANACDQGLEMRCFDFVITFDLFDHELAISEAADDLVGAPSSEDVLQAFDACCIFGHIVGGDTEVTASLSDYFAILIDDKSPSSRPRIAT